MLYLLLFFLLIDVIAFYTIRKTLLSPTLWMCVPYFVSTIAAIIGNELYWNISVNLITVVITEIGIISVFLGELLGSTSFRTYLFKRKRGNSCFGRINISKTLNILILVYCILIDCIFYKYNKSLGLTALELNEKANTDTTTFPIYLLILTRSVLGIGFVYVFVMANNLVYRLLTREKDSETWKYIFVLGAVIICQILHTSRGGLISYFLFFVSASFLILYRVGYRQISPTAIKKMIKKFIPLLIIVIVLFTIMGIVMGKFSEGIKAIRTLLVYLSGGVISFSLWFDQTLLIRNTTGTMESFYGVYTLLNHFGGNYDVGGRFEEFVRVEGTFSSNVYGGLKSYYYDMGIVGVIIFGVVLGFVFRKLMKIATNTSSSYLTLLLCAYFCMALFNMSISSPTKQLFTLAWISQFLLMYCLASLIIKKSNKTIMI